MRVSLIFAAATALAGSTIADASVLYEFSNNANATGFTLTTADFLTAETSLAASALDSCNPLPPFASPCSNVTFYPANGGDDDLAITWDLGGGSFATSTYSFVLGSFQTEGLHLSGAGMLNVSVIESAIPESSTWGMMLLGFAASGLAIRRRRSELTPPLTN